jgi:ribosome-binding protein aMBF1 (putative translation factor)
MTIDVVADRVNRGLSQQQLADEIGVSVDVIRNVERTGKRPRPANALRVATHYGLMVTEMWPNAKAAA